MEQNYLLEARNIKQYFKINDDFTVRAVDDVSFGIRRGEVFGLVGESGCGKSTIARTISGIYRPTSGEVFFDGTLVSGRNASKAQRRRMQREMQMVFQDSAAALNPHMTIEKILREPLHLQKLDRDREAVRSLMSKRLKQVGLDDMYLSKYPSELSGGQRQRLAIARSLMLNPRMIVADEPIASMDLSIQAQIINLFLQMQREEKFSMLFIAHDLSVMRLVCDRAAVMLQGKIVEMADIEELFEHPIHAYTKSLLSAICIPDPIWERNKKIIDYDRSAPLGTEMKEVKSGHFLLV